jgi:hypothetical protein
MAEWAVANDGYAMLFTPWYDGMLDSAFGKVVENLVAGYSTLARNLQRLFEIGNIKVADAPGQDLPVALELLERADGSLQRVSPAPMQQIAIEPVGFEARERPLTGSDRPGAGRILRQDLRDQEDLITTTRDRLGYDVLGDPVHFRRIDMRHSKVESTLQSGNRRGPAAAIYLPGSLADHSNVAISRTEHMLFHCGAASNVIGHEIGHKSRATNRRVSA